MSVWWVVGAAVLLLALLLAGLGHWAGVWDLFWWLRGEDDTADYVAVPDLRWQDHGTTMEAQLYADPDPGLPGLLEEPSDGDAYAAELHHIGELAAADVLELHTAWYPGRMPAWYPIAGGTLEDWERCLRWGQRRYWQARRREWAAETQEWWADYREWREQMGLAA